MATGGLSCNNVLQTLEDELIRVLGVLGFLLGALLRRGRRWPGASFAHLQSVRACVSMSAKENYP